MASINGWPNLDAALRDASSAGFHREEARALRLIVAALAKRPGGIRISRYELAAVGVDDHLTTLDDVANNALVITSAQCEPA